MDKNKVFTHFYGDFLNELKIAAPKLFIVDNYNRSIGSIDRIDDDINNYPDLIKFIKNYYILDKKIYLYDIYKKI